MVCVAVDSYLLFYFIFIHIYRYIFSPFCLDRYLDYFHVLTIRNHATVNILVHVA